MRFFLFVSLVLVSSLTCQLGHSATELARVNSSVITLESFNDKLKENQKFFRYKAPTQKTILDEMINRDLGIQEARRLNLDKDPEVMERINTVLYHSLIEKKLNPEFEKVQISKEEIEKYYKSNPEVRTSHIFVQVRFDANAAQNKAALDKIQKIQTILNDGEKSGKLTFAEVARQHSEGVAAATGGDIDYQTKDKLDPTYYETAVKLGKVGARSGIVRSQFGFHIIKLTGIKEFKDVDPGLYKRIIFNERQTSIFESYMSQLKSKAKISVKYDLLKGSS